MRRRWGVAVAAAACGLLLSRPAGAAVSEEARCTIVKLKATVKELKDKAQCYERSVKVGAPVEAGCFARAEKKRARLFERAEEAGACRTTKDGPAMGTRIDAFLRDVTRSLEVGSAATATPAPTATSGAAPAASDKTSGTTSAVESKTASRPKAVGPQGSPAPKGE